MLTPSQSNWRWTHITNGYANCFGGEGWNATHCADNAACAKNCAIDGANYAATYGITTPSSGALRLNFVTKNDNGQNVGSRVYLLASDTKYRTFNLLNKEFTFTVDVSKLSCGLNGAVYFSEMDADVRFYLSNLTLWCILTHHPGRHVALHRQQGRRGVRHGLLRRAVPARYQVHQRRGQRGRLEGRGRRHGLVLRRDGHLGGQQRRHGLHAAPVQRVSADQVHRHRLRRR